MTTNTNNLSEQARLLIATADFRQCWPMEARKDLVRAAKHVGEFPPYAVQRVERAVRIASAIERRMAADIRKGEATLSYAERRRLLATS